jgi:hypothetical protein
MSDFPEKTPSIRQIHPDRFEVNPHDIVKIMQSYSENPYQYVNLETYEDEREYINIGGKVAIVPLENITKYETKLIKYIMSHAKYIVFVVDNPKIISKEFRVGLAHVSRVKKTGYTMYFGEKAEIHAKIKDLESVEDVISTINNMDSDKLYAPQ